MVSPLLGSFCPSRAIKKMIETQLDSSLRDIVERILPLGTYYTAAVSFIERRSHLDFGLINHALCAAMRGMLSVFSLSLSIFCPMLITF